MKFLQDRWKQKAIKRQSENRKLKKRVKELTESRELWKNTAQEYKELNHELEKDLKKKI